jgi:dihydrofolate synthase/folylpolyglutamate synthase
LNIPAAAIASGLTDVHLLGRFQLISPDGMPAWVLDVAHNPDAARVLAANLKANPISGRTLAVCGILADKDAAGIAATLDRCIDSWWCASVDGTRGRSGVALAEAVRQVVRTPVAAADSVASACAAASSAAERQDRIVVFGSFHTVGPAIDWLESRGLLPDAARHEYTSP